MTKRITIIDVAERVGVHFTTVALALRESPRVHAATRDKVQAMAREMGYVPDPMLSALSAYRKAQKPANYQETLVWATAYPTRDGWREGAAQIFHQGAENRASELGYRLEPFWLKEPGLSEKRASTVLCNRGIRGLLIAPLPFTHGYLDLDWKLFSAVTIGFSLMRPRLHRVASYDVPEDVGIASTNTQGEKKNSDVQGTSLQVGEAAVDLLADLIRRGKKGLPEFPSHLLIEGR